MRFNNCAVLFVVYFNLSNGITVEEFTTLSEKQKLALDELRKRVEGLLVKDYTKEDHFLVRWLREADFDVNFAERMVKDNLKWRKENKIDNILDEDFSDLDSEYHVYMEGCDKDGTPILVLPFEEWDMRKAILNGKGPKLVRYVHFLTEYCIWIMTQMQASGENVTHIVALLDLENTSAVQHACPLCISTYLQIVLSYQNRYPGYLNRAIAVNTPEFFIPPFNTFKPLLSKNLQNIYYIFGSNKREWRRQISNFVDKSSISKKYGGSRERSIDATLLRKVVKENNVIYSCDLLAEDLDQFGDLSSGEIFN